MADENYTIEVSAKIKGDLEKGLGKIAKYAEKASDKTDELEKELKSLKAKPLRDLQKASEMFSKSINKLKPKPLQDISKSAKTLGKNLKDIKPKPIDDVAKAAGKLDKTFAKIKKAKPFAGITKSAGGLVASLKKIKSKPLDDLARSATKVQKSISSIKAKPLRDATTAAGGLRRALESIKANTLNAVSTAAERLRGGLERIRGTQLRTLGQLADRASGRILNLVRNTLLLGNNLQGIVLLAVNRLRAAFVELTDQFNRVVGQMEKWSGSMDKALDLVAQLQNISVDTGWDLDALSSTFTKLGTGLEGLGLKSSELMRLTRGLGLIFRQVGADGGQMAKVAGQISLMFTRTTVPFEKLESLLGRGRYEQILRSLARELGRLKGVDITSWADGGQTALARLKDMMDQNIVSGADLREAWINLLREGNLLGTRATEIGHGFDQLSMSISVMITRIDTAIGLSRTIAGVMSDISRIILWLTDNIRRLFKLGIVVVVSWMVLNLPKVAKALAAIGLVVAKLAKYFVALAAAIALVITKLGGPIKVAAMAIITALTLFGKELDKVVDKYAEKIKGFSPTFFKILKAITSTLASLEKIFDKIVGIKTPEEKQKDLKDKQDKESTVKKGGNRFGKWIDDEFLVGPPGQRDDKPVNYEDILAKTVSKDEKRAKFEASVTAAMEGYKDASAALRLKLPGASPAETREVFVQTVQEFRRLSRENGQLLRDNDDLRRDFLQKWDEIITLGGTTHEFRPEQLLTGFAAEIHDIGRELKSLELKKKAGHVSYTSESPYAITPEEYDERRKGLRERAIQSVDKWDVYYDKRFQGARGQPLRSDRSVAVLKDILTATKDVAEERMSPADRAVTDLEERQQRAFLASSRGHISPEDTVAEHTSIYGEGKDILYKFSDELNDNIQLASRLFSVMRESKEYIPDPLWESLKGFYDRSEDLNEAYADGRIKQDKWLEGMASLGVQVEDFGIKNHKAIKANKDMSFAMSVLTGRTKKAVEWFKPLNVGFRGIGKTFHNLNLASKDGILVGQKQAEMYVALNDKARDFRRVNYAQLKQNPKLLKEINEIIKKTDLWRKVLAKVQKPEPTGTEKFALKLGFGKPGKDKEGKDLAQTPAQEAEMKQAAQMMTDALLKGIDRIKNEGVQGRDLGKSGEIGFDFVKNLIKMGPALATLKAVLDLIVEVLVQAASMANLFGEGMQKFFDPINRFITDVADAISPIFDMVGEIFAMVGYLLEGARQILAPILKLVKSILRVVQAIIVVFKPLFNIVGQLLKAVGVIISKVLQPVIDFFNDLAKSIITGINVMIGAINRLIPGKRWDLDYVSLEGKKHEKPKEEGCPGGDTGDGCPTHDDEVRDKLDVGNEINARQLAQLERANKALEDENRLRAQAAREIVRVKEIGSITEARQRGVITGQQDNEPQPVINRIINVNSPQEIAPSRANERTVMNWLRENAGANGGLPEVVNG